MAERKGPNKTALLQIRYRNGITFPNHGIIPDAVITALPFVGRERLRKSPQVKTGKIDR